MNTHTSRSSVLALAASDMPRLDMRTPGGWNAAQWPTSEHDNKIAHCDGHGDCDQDDNAVGQCGGAGDVGADGCGAIHFVDPNDRKSGDRKIDDNGKAVKCSRAP